MSSKNKSAGSGFALVALALSMLLSSIGVSIPNVALPTFANVFSASLPGVQWVILAYLLAVTSMIVGVGRLGDMYGRRTVLLGGIALFTFAALLCGIAPTLWFLIGARALQGLGAATLMALTVASVSEIIPKEKLGQSMGLLGTMSAVGTAIGPTLGGFLISWLSWRWVFLAMVPLGSLALFLIRRYLPAPKVRATTNFQGLDITGTALLAVSLIGYALAVTLGGSHLDKKNLVWIVVAIASGGVFVWNESKVRSPLLKWDLLRGSNIFPNLILNVLVSSVMMATLVVGPFYLSHGMGLNAGLVGLMMSTGPITSSLTGILAGRIVDRFGVSVTTIIGLCEMMIGVLSMSRLPPILGGAGYVISSILLSPGYQMFQAANNTGVMSKVMSEHRGVVSGMLSLSRNLGLITGTSLMGAIFSYAAGTTRIATGTSKAVTQGMQVTFSFATVLTVVALLIAIKLSKQVPSNLKKLRQLSVNRG